VVVTVLYSPFLSCIGFLFLYNDVFHTNFIKNDG
jgi:hypothetical protein